MPTTGPRTLIRAHLRAARWKSLAPPLEIVLPQFTVLVGENGVGKSHLLTLLYEGLREPLDGRGVSLLEVEGGPLRRTDVVLQRGEWELSNPTADFGLARERSQSALDAIRTSLQGYSGYGSDDEYAKRVRGDRLRTQLGSVTDAQVVAWMEKGDYSALPRAFSFSSRTEPNALVSDVCTAFHLHFARLVEEAAVSRTTLEQFIEQRGPAPWDRLNEFIGAAGIKLRCPAPSLPLHRPYYFRFVTPDGAEVWPSEMSSGERTIVALAAWLVTAGEYGLFPRVVLLDEADAHLHAALIPGFVNALRTVLVDTYGSSVVLATHRTETALSVPAESIVEMHRATPRLRAASTSRTAARLLTGGNFLLPRERRCVMVEDADDAEFYQTATSLLPANELSAGWVSPIFQPASIGKGPAKVAGGRDNVEGWVDKLARSGLDGLVVGLVDRDRAPSIKEGIFSIQRYSIENYLVDPLVMFFGLLDRGQSRFPSLPFRRGEEARCRSLDNATLQRIADTVLSPVISATPQFAASAPTVEIRYLDAGSIVVPRWLLDARGKDVLEAFRVAYPHDAQFLWPTPLIRAFERLGLLPVDLVDTLLCLGRT